VELTHLAPEDPKVLSMPQHELIRRLILVDGLSQREVARQLGHSRKTIAKAIKTAAPKPYTLAAPKPRPKLDHFCEIVRQWLLEDQTRHHKQRHTAVRIHERLVNEHDFTGGRRAVSELVKQLRRELKPPEVYVPIEHPPGDEVQIDWGQAEVVINGEATKVMLFCARLPYSKATYVRAYLREDQPSFLDAHVHLIDYLGGVPRIFAYDNLKSAVTSVIGRERALNRKFLELRSHYLFETRFCNVARGNEKGHVENAVKRSQQNYLTPVPSLTSLAQLNEHLLTRCQADLARNDRSSGKTYGQLFHLEREKFLETPAEKFRPCVTRAARVDRYATVQHDEVRYSVPVKHACEHSIIRVGVDTVEVIVRNTIVATHRRGEPGNWVLSMEHYLPALERKPGLLDSGKPFQNGAFTDSERLLRRELEYRYSVDGTRQFLNILLLSREYDFKLVRDAIERCVRQRAFHEEAVRLELHQLTQSPAETCRHELDLHGREELQQVGDGCRDLAMYDQLQARESTVEDSLAFKDSAFKPGVHESVPVSILTQWSATNDNDVQSENDNCQTNSASQNDRLECHDTSLGDRPETTSFTNVLGGVFFTLCGVFA
jgi:transposase